MTLLSTSASKSEHAYQWTLEHIHNKAFTPGYRLVLQSIAAELDMSVVPVREALRRLEAEGYVTFERNVGARVTTLDDREYRHTMQTLGVVEGAAVSLALPHLTEDVLAQAAALNERMRELLGQFDSAAFAQLNRQFHVTLSARCPNPHLLDLVERGWARTASFTEPTFAVVPERALRSVLEHEEILTLIRDHADAHAVEQAVRDHRRRTMDAYLQNHTALP